ncbi:hypothetical protein L596_001210 [Steinernema carpocapsae]|uniref:Uncharacterized protein n=1 Tax=Steinernema carpocapsae TaxID=34508 RepID=A0A4U8UKL5_STECR|nr:hypothetical protein L596_001210 [Steinernema carpocapsae]
MCSITEVVDNFESGSRPDDILLGPLHDQTTLILKMRSDIGPYLESQIVPVEVSWTKLIAEVHKKPSQKTLEEFLSAHEKETKNYWGHAVASCRKQESLRATQRSRPTTVRATTGYLTLKGYLDAISVETIGCLEQMTKEAEFLSSGPR